MSADLQAVMERLSSTQRHAVEWGSGPALVLAGPGVGKTTVLTARIARILDASRDKQFRVLALTFTTKAGDEMRERVEHLVPGLAERTVIGTFHAFCTQVLRQHGSHVEIQPDFGVYDQDADREELLREALREAAANGEDVSPDDVRWLRAIDQLRGKLVGPQASQKYFRDVAVGARVARVYDIYEKALRAKNILDFNGMILDTCRLVQKMPAVATRIQQSYPHWMIDEFQDTTPAQYSLVRLLAGETFKNLFVVADDDQIIYQWAGASYRQITTFREDFKPELFQLVENRRCPPQVVQAANNLIMNNAERTPGKERLVAMCKADGEAVSLRTYANEGDEAAGVAVEIQAAGKETWGKTAVLGRTRAALAPVLAALRESGVDAAIATRRDRFLSPQFVWLQACLDQSLRPTDRQVFVVMVDAANRMASTEFDAALIQVEAEGIGRSYIEQWTSTANASGNSVAQRLGQFANKLIQTRSAWSVVLSDALEWLPTTSAENAGEVSDVADDKAAWDAASRAIRSAKGSKLELSELLQGIALRPKEPPPAQNSVALMTIHAAKGLEFDHVWVVGLAETVLPSWQSLKPDAKPAEIEEERRNCFVAITRTRRTLVLSRAASYRGWAKEPSRFLSEMGFDVGEET